MLTLFQGDKFLLWQYLPFASPSKRLLGEIPVSSNPLFQYSSNQKEGFLD